MYFHPKRFLTMLPRWLHRWRLRFSDVQILAGSFLAILLPSAYLLTLPAFAKVPITFTDALFTASSAMTVTGLGVIDTAQSFSRAGHILLMCLMEIGGLGQMTFSTLLIVFLGARLSLTQRSLTQSQFNVDATIHITDLIKRIIIFALVSQLIGALILSFTFVAQRGWGEGLFYALFHAISAFNNAGFSLFSSSLIDYRANSYVIFTIAFLIIIGGIGFTVANDIWRWRCRPTKRNHGAILKFSRLTLHSKLMLLGTLLLVVGGTVAIFLIEHFKNPQFAVLASSEQWLMAFFQSVTARTAGFASMDIANMHRASIYVIIVLMLIGAGSASAAGGLKISTVFVACSATLGFIRKVDNVALFRRSISWDLAHRALAMIVISMSLITVAIFLLLISEKASLDMVLFEVVSAFSTVGLTIGLTERLSEFGKFVIIIVMIVGRIGPLTVFYLLTKPQRAHMKYADGYVLVG